MRMESLLKAFYAARFPVLAAREQRELLALLITKDIDPETGLLLGPTFDEFLSTAIKGGVPTTVLSFNITGLSRGDIHLVAELAMENMGNRGFFGISASHREVFRGAVAELSHRALQEAIRRLKEGIHDIMAERVFEAGLPPNISVGTASSEEVTSADLLLRVARYRALADQIRVTLQTLVKLAVENPTEYARVFAGSAKDAGSPTQKEMDALVRMFQDGPPYEEYGKALALHALQRVATNPLAVFALEKFRE